MIRRITLISVGRNLGIALEDIARALEPVPWIAARAKSIGSAPPRPGSKSWNSAAAPSKNWKQG
ncbi:hypothetical protein [Arthrobacter sp. JCM 19049]|uniref:hypothetical protein n=1 Tax=Arthrobacter sp. JCM 19049 TaxID=1460643 RepID=UPI000A6C45B1|nr:hypothetical protein [Arthrobacter sp. JCM 19049]